MKTKERENDKKGISLIVLVITIIVIIILALSVILSINKNNPIGNARIAKEKNNEKVYQEELELYVANKFVNNHEFNRETLNVFNIKDAITSISNEDEEKYIVWQGKLAKKDGEIYKYINNNEEIKTLAEEPITKEMIEFLKEFESIQKEREKAGEYTLLYNGGYITNCGGNTGLSIKDKLPDGVEILGSNGTSVDLKYSIVTDYQIKYKNEIVAKFVLYGDTSGTDRINSNDTQLIYNIIHGIVKKPGEHGYTIGMFIAADTDHDGVITKADAELIMKYINNHDVINQNIIPLKPKI